MGVLTSRFPPVSAHEQERRSLLFVRPRWSRPVPLPVRSLLRSPPDRCCPEPLLPACGPWATHGTTVRSEWAPPTLPQSPAHRLQAGSDRRLLAWRQKVPEQNCDLQDQFFGSKRPLEVAHSFRHPASEGSTTASSIWQLNPIYPALRPICTATRSSFRKHSSSTL